MHGLEGAAPSSAARLAGSDLMRKPSDLLKEPSRIRFFPARSQARPKGWCRSMLCSVHVANIHTGLHREELAALLHQIFFL